jgi:site-specific recombinase XerD
MYSAVCQDIRVAQSLPDLAALLPSWQLAMRAERKAPGTIKTYSDGVTGFLRWCKATGTTAELTKTTVQTFIGDLLDNGGQAATAQARQLALKRFAAWLVDEGELDADPLLGMKQPRLDRKVINALTDDELRRLIKACQGTSLRDRRDEAIIRLMAETGLRAGEVIGLQTTDVDLQRGLLTVRQGFGGKGRVAPFGAQAATAIDRYLRARRSHRLADTGPLWVGGGGKTFGYYGLNTSLKERAQAAGIEGFHLHLMRHTAATRWLRAGGSESGLMAVAGWSTRDMIDRYTGASASERAADEARTLGLGEL